MWNAANTLRASVLDEPRFWLHLHGWTTIAWLLQFPLVFLWQQELQDSVPYLVGISIAAAALGQASAWQAARVEMKLKTMQEVEEGQE
jgi:hypothetical protein